jgi:adenylate kinase family enzyme
MIIMGFPGVGKTTFAKKYPDLAIDLESSNFCYTKESLQKLRAKGLNNENIKGNPNRVKVKNWRKLYLKSIEENLKKYKFIFTSQDSSFIEHFKNENILIILPQPQDIEIYKNRYENRGNTPEWIDSVLPFLIIY